MKNCEGGCPCEFYNCTLTGDHLQGTLDTEPIKLDGECYKNFFNSSVPNAIAHKKVTQYGGSLYTSSQACITACQKLYHESYKYAALERGGYCYCGGAEPYEELYGKCGMPCSGAHTDYCGGPEDTASFFSLDNTNQRCTYSSVLQILKNYLLHLQNDRK